MPGTVSHLPIDSQYRLKLVSRMAVGGPASYDHPIDYSPIRSDGHFAYPEEPTDWWITGTVRGFEQQRVFS